MRRPLFRYRFHVRKIRGTSLLGRHGTDGRVPAEAASLVSPTLTTMPVPARDEGRAGAELLLRRLAETEESPPTTVGFPQTPIRRESV